ncbi:hypothetical protein L210DRAFT_3499293 [Boletus edulis BED1]|uniref:Uncharacterized protein n=1 Tax=Boletus edulis BED1 TaxID=1328754 RepID=A0AAD4C866_BOLED|nr:hypothetical protein L210DRAFT_3499293 [Boletus edulis BED1]
MEGVFCLQSLNDFPEQLILNTDRSSSPTCCRTWHLGERRRREVDLADGDPIVVVVDSGLEVAVILKYLGLPHLVIDKKVRVGDNTHETLVEGSLQHVILAHDNLVQSDTLLAMSLIGEMFTPTWPVFTSARKVADWLEVYANYLELNVWTSPVITETEGNDDLKTWTVKDTRTFKVKHLVFATGFGGRPKVRQGDLVSKLASKDSEDFKGSLPTSLPYPPVKRIRQCIVLHSANHG